MSWKDKWTALMWRITFPGEELPLDILPSNYAQLPEEPKKLSLEEALTQAVIMDMQTYPSQWKEASTSSAYTTIYLNKETDIKIKHTFFSSGAYYINDMPISRGQGSRIVAAFGKRHGAEILEKLIDRIQKIETVEYEEVKEEARPKTIDPFSIPQMEILSQTVEKLRTAEAVGKALPPPPFKLTGPSSIKKIPIKEVKFYANN